MGSLKLLILSTNYFPKIGGAEISLDNVIKQLTQLGHSVSLVTAIQNRSQAAFEEDKGFKIYRTHLGVPHRRWRLLSLALFPFRFFRSVGTLVKATSELNPNCIMVFFVDDAMLYAWVLERLYRLPIVLNFRGADIEDFPKTGFMHNLLLKLGLNRTRAIVTPSQYLMSVVKKYRPTDKEIIYRVVRNGVDLKKFHKPTPYRSSAPYALVACRLVHKKGVDIVIRAFAELPPKMHSFKLIIAGQGPEELSLRDLVDELNLNHQVEFLGEVSPEQIPSLIHGSQMVVLASRQEPFGNIVSETIASNKLILASNVGGIPELITQSVNGYLFPAEDHTTLANLIATHYSPNADKVIKNASQMHSLSSWETQSHEYLQLFQEICATRP